MDPSANACKCCRAHLNPLHLAVLDGYIERTVAVLAGGSVDVDQGDPKYRVTPLMMAAHTGYLRIGRALIDNGANVSMVDDDSYAALHLCAENGHVAFVELLIGAVPTSRS